MTRIAIRFVTVSVLCVAAAISGCASDPHDNSLKVRGDVVTIFAGGTGTTQFNFATDTLLYDDRVDPGNGVTAGHCTIQQGPVGVPDVLDFGVTRTSDTGGDLGMRSINVRVDNPEAPLAGSVTIDIGGVPYTVSAGAACNINLLSYDIQDRVAMVSVSDCTVSATGGDTATVTASLEYMNCDVR